MAMIFWGLLRLLGIKKPNGEFSARFANKKERNRVLKKKNKGLHIADNKFLSRQDSFKHLILSAPTRSGKTASYVAPALFRLKGSSAVVTDLKGELFKISSGHLASRGFKIKVLDLNGGASLFINPLLRAKNDLTQLRNLIYTIVERRVRGNDPFWAAATIEFIFLLASALTNYNDDKYITFKNLSYMVSRFGTKELDDFMAEHLQNELLFSKYERLRGSRSTNTLEGIIMSANAALDYFNDPILEKVFSQDTVDISFLRQDLGVLYLIVSINKVKLYSLALDLIYNAVFDEIFSKNPDEKVVPLFFLIDEAGNQKIDQLSSVVTIAGGFKVSISLIIQDLSQLKEMYGENGAKTILSGGISNRIFFGGLAPSTTDTVSKMLGEKLIENKNGSKYYRPLMKSDEIRMLDNQILISGSHRPILLDMQPYYKDKELKRYSKKSPVELERVEHKGYPLLKLVSLDKKT